jgi:HPt (histidine-containing phosphotransfer) domain-containing protein
MEMDSSRQGDFLSDVVAEDVLELRSLYLDYLKGEIDTFRSLLVRKDLVKIRELGHRLKGSGGSYGLHGISDLGETIQYLPAPPMWDQVEVLFHQLEEAYEQVVKNL